MVNNFQKLLDIVSGNEKSGNDQVEVDCKLTAVKNRIAADVSSASPWGRQNQGSEITFKSLFEVGCKEKQCQFIIMPTWKLAHTSNSSASWFQSSIG